MLTSNDTPFLTIVWHASGRWIIFKVASPLAQSRAQPSVRLYSTHESERFVSSGSSPISELLQIRLSEQKMPSSPSHPRSPISSSSLNPSCIFVCFFRTVNFFLREVAHRVSGLLFFRANLKWSSSDLLILLLVRSGLHNFQQSAQFKSSFFRVSSSFCVQTLRHPYNARSSSFSIVRL